MSQERLGHATGGNQPAVKKAQNSPDPRVSTLRRFIEGLGRATETVARLEVRAIIGEETFVIDIASPADEATESATTESDDAARAWRLRAWDDPVIERAMLDGQLIAISADEIGDVSEAPTIDQYRSRLRGAPSLATRSEQAIGTFAGYWNMFRSVMRPGDIVAVPLGGRRVAIAEVVGDYTYRPSEEEPRLRHIRRVRWLATGLPRQLLPDDLRKVVNAPGTICSIRAVEATGRLRSVAG